MYSPAIPPPITDNVVLVNHWFLPLKEAVLDFEFFDYSVFFFACNFGDYVEELFES